MSDQELHLRKLIDQLERENAALRNLLHEIQENTSIGIKTCARIHAALDAERKENK